MALTDAAGTSIAQTQTAQPTATATFTNQPTSTGEPTLTPTATATGIAAPGVCQLIIPVGSVVAALPNGARAYWAPGKLMEPVVFVNPGSYWVIGQDASGGYYNILIACAFVWVPKDAMTTYSDGVNWFNNPLPTRIVG